MSDWVFGLVLLALLVWLAIGVRRAETEIVSNKIHQQEHIIYSACDAGSTRFVIELYEKDSMVIDEETKQAVDAYCHEIAHRVVEESLK